MFKLFQIGIMWTVGEAPHTHAHLTWTMPIRSDIRSGIGWQEWSLLVPAFVIGLPRPSMYFFAQINPVPMRVPKWPRWRPGKFYFLFFFLIHILLLVSFEKLHCSSFDFPGWFIPIHVITHILLRACFPNCSSKKKVKERRVEKRENT